MEEGQAPWDPRVYFSLVFGSEGFVKYVGELQIAKMLRPPDQKAHGDEPDAHVFVIGAGSAGLTVCAALTAHGFKADELMGVVMRIQACAADDPSIAQDTMKLMKAAQGDISGLV